MKKTIIILVVLAIIFTGLYFGNKNLEEQGTITIKAPEIFNVPEVVEVNNVKEAERMLAEATAKLDAEQELLENEIEKIKEHASTSVAVLEKKIENINTIRSSF